MLQGVHGNFAGNDDAVVLPPTLCSAGEWLFYSVESERAGYRELRRLRRTCRLVVAGEYFDALQLECGLGMHLDIQPTAHILIALLVKGGQSGRLEMQSRLLNRRNCVPLKFGIATELFCLAVEIMEERFTNEG